MSELEAPSSTSAKPSSAPSSASSSSSPISSTGWGSRAGIVFQGAMTLSIQIGALYFCSKRIDDAFTALIERGSWLPFVLLVAAVMATVAPLTFDRIASAGKALLPKRGD